MVVDVGWFFRAKNGPSELEQRRSAGTRRLENVQSFAKLVETHIREAVFLVQIPAEESDSIPQVVAIVQFENVCPLAQEEELFFGGGIDVHADPVNHRAEESRPLLPVGILAQVPIQPFERWAEQR